MVVGMVNETIIYIFKLFKFGLQMNIKKNPNTLQVTFLTAKKKTEIRICSYFSSKCPNRFGCSFLQQFESRLHEVSKLCELFPNRSQNFCNLRVFLSCHVTAGWLNCYDRRHDNVCLAISTQKVPLLIKRFIREAALNESHATCE